ncbi:MAG: DipZ protein [Verrucomicrobiaceae bacterium]|nr:DipZ protein [Verrucomicrobiaceae bacterium]
MLIAIIAFLGGALTILSPCILPVLPFVFARTERSFAKSTLPLLIGMALTFAVIATLAAVGGGWAVRLNTYGRVFALVLLTAFGVALLSRRLADWIAKPFVALGNRLLQRTGSGGNASVLQSFVIGIATGFLWAPCAGPILGLILTGAAISGPNTQTSLLLFAYALGAMTSLAIATRAGNRLFAALKQSFGAGEWVRRGLGVAVIAAVVAISLGLDTGLLTQLSLSSTNRLEQSLLAKLNPESAQDGGTPGVMNGAMNGSMTSAMNGSMTNSMNGGADSNVMSNTMMGGAMMAAKASTAPVADEGELPSLDGAVTWLNSAPLTAESLRGKVVLIDFWTYSCINCLRTLPYVKNWYDKYKDHGLVVIGVHAPEFAFEKDEKNVRRAVRDLGVTYPVALDNNYVIWKAFGNRYWPAHYFIDANGRIRGHHFGEGNYDESEQLIRKLLEEANVKNLPTITQAVPTKGIEMAADDSSVGSPETYVGYERAENFSSSIPFARDQAAVYTAPKTLQLNQWALDGKWTVGGEQAIANETHSKIIYHFHARDLHLVLGPAVDDKPIRFRVTIDGAAPGDDHGSDIDKNGEGIIREQRLYQLIRQGEKTRDRTFTIEFLDAGVQAYSFTFG